MYSFSLSPLYILFLKVFDQTVWPYRKRRAHLTKCSRLWGPGWLDRWWGIEADKFVCVVLKIQFRGVSISSAWHRPFSIFSFNERSCTIHMPSTIFLVKGKHEKTTLITFVKPIPVDFTCLFGITSNDSENHRNAVPDSCWCTRRAWDLSHQLR